MKSVSFNIDYWQQTLNFFQLRTRCPICDALVSRELTAAFTNTNATSTYVSDPEDMKVYSQLIFTRDNKKKYYWIDDQQFSITPSSLNFIEKSPPAFQYLSLKNSTVYLFHGAKDHFYELRTEIGDFSEMKENWVLDELDIDIYNDEIYEHQSHISIPTRDSYLLKFDNKNEFKKFIEKLILLQ